MTEAADAQVAAVDWSAKVEEAFARLKSADAGEQNPRPMALLIGRSLPN